MSIPRVCLAALSLCACDHAGSPPQSTRPVEAPSSPHLLTVERDVAAHRLAVRATDPAGATDVIVVEGAEADASTIELVIAPDGAAATVERIRWAATVAGLAPDQPIGGPPEVVITTQLTWRAGVWRAAAPTICVVAEAGCGFEDDGEPPPEAEMLHPPELDETALRRAAHAWRTALVAGTLADQPLWIAIELQEWDEGRPPACIHRYAGVEVTTTTGRRGLARCLRPWAAALGDGWHADRSADVDTRLPLGFRERAIRADVVVALSGPDSDCGGSAISLAMRERDGAWQVDAAYLWLGDPGCEDP